MTDINSPPQPEDNSPHDASALGSWSASLQLKGLSAQDSPQQIIDAADAAEAHESVRYGFMVGGTALLLEPETPCEVMDRERVSRLPYTPQWFVGLVNVRGNLVPIFDLERLYAEDHQGGASSARQRYFLVVDRDERMAGFLSDHLPKAVRISGARPAPIPRINPLMQSHVREAMVVDGTTWLEFAHRDFLEAMAQNLANPNNE